MNINIAIVDDHNVVREGIRQLLEIDGDIKVVGEARDGYECMEMLKHTIPDVLLLDINMPNINGIEALRRFKDMGIKSKVIILTIHEDKEYILKTLKLGANGYMLKDSSANSLIEGIRRVAKGEKYIQSSVADLVSASRDDDSVDKSIEQINSLTNREYEVLILIAEGLNNKDIAERLYISEKTVKNHVSNIFKKLDLNDRVQAAICA